ncbi:hypothetical protein PENTCL1PPCAC_9550, partial [Pristionchus entomophagus]
VAVSSHTLSTEFGIARPCSIPSDGAHHKVTIGIVALEPQLVHESVPTKNSSAFLTASAINSSSLPLLAGKASVYLDGAFVAKTQIKAVSPGERFTSSLGVDPAVKIEYKAAHKHHEQTGLINKWSSTVTEQKIVVKNTRGDAVLLKIRERIPRSTDEKIKFVNKSQYRGREISGNQNYVPSSGSDPPNTRWITVVDLQVTMISPKDIENVTEEMNGENVKPKQGIRLIPSNNLEWTVRLEKGETQTLIVKYTIEHPFNERIEF